MVFGWHALRLCEGRESNRRRECYQCHSLSSNWFPGSAWEPTALQALPEKNVEAEPLKQRVPRQSLGTRETGANALRLIDIEELFRLRRRAGGSRIGLGRLCGFIVGYGDFF